MSGRIAAINMLVRAIVSVIIVVYWVAPAFGGELGQRRPLTVAEMLEARRAMVGPPVRVQTNGGHTTKRWPSPAVISPDGSKYVLMLISSDMASDGNWVELITGDMTSIDGAAKLRTVARLFTNSLGRLRGDGAGAPHLTYPSLNPPVWIDSTRVAFFWESESGVKQVLSANVVTGERTTLIKHPTDVVQFSISVAGPLIYTARSEYPRSELDKRMREGFVVTSEDAFSLLMGDVGQYSRNDRVYKFKRFVANAEGERAKEVIFRDGDGTIRYLPVLFRPRFSPNGRYVIVDGEPSTVPRTWRMYTDKTIGDFVSDTEAGKKVLSPAVHQLQIIETATGNGRPLWNAPMIAGREPLVTWSPDSVAVVIGPTCLPIASESDAGRAGTAVAELNVQTGRVRELPVPSSLIRQGLQEIVWRSSSVVELRTLQGMSLQFARTTRGWQPIEATGSAEVRADASGPIELIWRQDANTPPALFAKERSSGRERLIFDPTPQLRGDVTLGRVEIVQWPDRDGRTWSGRLFHPVGFREGVRYPLVIQTSPEPARDDEFSLNGNGGGTPGVGPSVGPYAAQPLANRGIMVLHVQSKTGAPQHEEAWINMSGFEAAVEHFSRKGLIDPSRVGLLGHSRTGWYVLHALTHSSVPYAAAIASDNIDGGYLQAALMSWRSDLSEKMYGEAPFGKGLKSWLENAPAFNAARIRTPLQLQRSNMGIAGLLVPWEIFSRLRALGKPVELYAIPDIELGTHHLQNPRQCFAVQQRAVDWFDYWLNNRERTDRASSWDANYREWRTLKSQQRHQAAVAVLSME